MELGYGEAVPQRTFFTIWGGAMIFAETKLAGAYVIDVQRHEDNRGFFGRVFCQNEFSRYGLKAVIAQANVAFNYARGTVRGMHFQYPPRAETKLVRCTRGAIFDIIVDLRPESPTFLDHIGVELSADNHRAIYVPERFAHGYQVLEDNTETSYDVGEFYAPGEEGGLHYADPQLQLEWPLPVTQISAKDTLWKPLAETLEELRARMLMKEVAYADH
jgi:dTDP-4-dehydrorhamnose 3,5-epimerase